MDATFVGTFDGALEGACEGAAVGALEGAADGALDGDLEGAADGAFDGGGEGALLRLLECFEAEVCEDLALDLLDWCEATLPSLLRRSTWSGTKEEMRVLGAALGAALWATLWALEATLFDLDTDDAEDSSGLVKERWGAVKEARDGATE